MGAKITIVGMYQKVKDIPNTTIIDTTSKSGTWSGLSPFNLGPCTDKNGQTALNFENFWQYLKVYKRDVDMNNNPTPEYYEWMKAGFNNPKACRYPMGRGAKPQYSLWHNNGQELHLGYIEARKAIYAPYYAKLVQATESYKKLEQLYHTESHLILRDYDGYDHDKLGLSLTQVLNNPARKMGHAFVLKMLLTNDTALQEFNY